jgi:hypothetical protein
VSEDRFRDRTDQVELFGNDEDFKIAWQEWKGMPEFSHEDLTPFASVIVHFANREDMKAFEALVGQRLSGTQRKTQSIWYPKVEVGNAASKRYRDASGDSEP